MAYLAQNMALVDKETGEILQDKVYFFGNKPTDTGFVKVFVAFLEDMVVDVTIAGKAIRLLLYAVQRTDWNNLEVYLFYKDAVKELKINHNTYFRWLKALMDNFLLH